LADEITRSLGTMADVVEDVFNRHMIPRLLRLNGMPEENPPKWRHGDIETMDLEELGKYIERLAKSGFPLFPTASGELERRLLEQASLPQPPEGEDFPEIRTEVDDGGTDGREEDGDDDNGRAA